MHDVMGHDKVWRCCNSYVTTVLLALLFIFGIFLAWEPHPPWTLTYPASPCPFLGFAKQHA